LGSFTKFGDLGGQLVPNALYAVAMALDGASRINDNQHFLHDVLFGATIGLALVKEF
jgi:hypothetical protein